MRGSYGHYIHNQKLKVYYNEYGTERFMNTQQTRVIDIEGPEESGRMSFEFWDKYFASVCLYDYECVRYLQPECNSNLRMEFRFSRIDGQAETLMQAIRKTAAFDNIIKARYGRDPSSPYPFRFGPRYYQSAARNFKISLNSKSRFLREPKFED